MAHVRGISPVPRIPLLSKDPVRWSLWARWFERLTEATYRIRTYSESLDVAGVPATAESVQSFSVPGLSVDDIVTVNKKTNTVGLDLVQAWVSANDILSLKFRNVTGSPINLAPETYLVSAIRR